MSRPGAPSSPTSSRLVRGTSYRGGNELGTITRTADTRLAAVDAMPLRADTADPVKEEAEAAAGASPGEGDADAAVAIDPADPQAGRWQEASLEDQATAFLTAHGLDEDAQEQDQEPLDVATIYDRRFEKAIAAALGGS